MSKNYSFHQNRYKIANAIGLAFIIFAIYFKKDLLYMTPKITMQTLSTPAEKIDKRPYIDLDFSHRINEAVLQAYSKNSGTLTIFAFNPIIVHEGLLIPVMCNSKIVLAISDEFSLDNIRSEHKERLLPFKVGDASTIPKDMLNPVSRSYLNDKVYVCKIDKKKFYNRNNKEIKCQYFHVLETENNTPTKPFEILYIKEGNGKFANCNEKVSFSYEIYSLDKLIKQGFISTKIGDGTLPYQIERGILNSNKGAMFEVKTRINDINMAIFNIESSKNITNHEQDATLIFKIKL